MGGEERAYAIKIGRSIDIQEPECGRQISRMLELTCLDEVLDGKDCEGLGEVSGSRPECGEAAIIA